MSEQDVTEARPGPSVARRSRALAFAAVVVLLLAVAGVTTWAITRASQPGATLGSGPSQGSCDVASPTTTAEAAVVPGTPTASGTDGRLVPDRVPTEVVVCEYGGAAARTGPEGRLQLARSATFVGSDPTVTGLVTALRDAPVRPDLSAGGCAVSSDAVVERPVVELTYPDGQVWVALTGCDVVSNGDVAAVVDLLGLTRAVLDTTVEPAPPLGTDPAAGRPGAGPTIAPGPDNPFASCTAAAPAPGTGLVPFTPVGVRVCHLGVDPAVHAPTAVERPADVAVGLASALAALPVLGPDVACTAIGGEQWALLFTADDGRTAAVQVDAGGCGSATNGVSTVRTDAAVFAALDAAD